MASYFKIILIVLSAWYAAAASSGGAAAEALPRESHMPEQTEGLAPPPSDPTTLNNEGTQEEPAVEVLDFRIKRLERPGSQPEAQPQTQPQPESHNQK